MKTLFKPGIWRILRLFYENRNKPLHLRDIARKAKLNESSISRHLNSMVKAGILVSQKDGNMRKFQVFPKRIPEIFPLFDSERLGELPLLRRDAIKIYLAKLQAKPLLLVVFGSTASGTYRKDSDIDILEISSSKSKDAEEYAETQTGMHVQIFRMGESEFYQELALKKDMVVQSALETGFPVFNAKYFYELVLCGYNPSLEKT